MGGNCCVAAREKPLPPIRSIEVSTTRRNIRYSPSWSFRWDNRTHIEDIIDAPRFSQNNSGNISSDTKSGADTETEGCSDGSSPLDAFGTHIRQKSQSSSEISRNARVAADIFIGSSSLPEENDSVESSIIASASDTKPSLSIHLSPISSVSTADHTSSSNCSLPTDLTKSKKTQCSPGHQLSRQVSVSTIHSLKSLNENNFPDGQQSFCLSPCSNDLLTVGSHGGSSDGWSMRTFSELVASSQKERWSIGSENPCFANNKFAKSNAQASSSLGADVDTCGVCSKLLKDRSGALRWSSNTLAVVAILVCGHVYHAECLESVTSETAKFDPSCPVCHPGEKPCKLLAKFDSKAKNKLSRIAVAAGAVAEYHKKGKAPKMGASSSMKSSTFARPFLRRHFSIGSSRSVRPMSESETTTKKGFWARYRRD